MALVEGTALKAIVVSSSWLVWLIGLVLTACGGRRRRAVVGRHGDVPGGGSNATAP
jgi:hypothetical protein